MIQDNIRHILDSIPSNVTLVAVSKTKPISSILEAYEFGQLIFGENKVQELVSKHETLPKEIEWHMIGHLQRNKVKYIAPFVALIHGVDTLKLLKEVNKEADKNNRIIDCLVQVHIAREETKHGFSEEEILNFFESKKDEEFSHVRIRGLMGMATFTDDTNIVANEFKGLRTLFEQISSNKDEYFNILSMGMSGDYKLAIENGSTMIRVGSSIFGSR